MYVLWFFNAESNETAHFHVQNEYKNYILMGNDILTISKYAITARNALRFDVNWVFVAKTIILDFIMSHLHWFPLPVNHLHVRGCHYNVRYINLLSKFQRH